MFSGTPTTWTGGPSTQPMAERAGSGWARAKSRDRSSSCIAHQGAQHSGSDARNRLTAACKVALVGESCNHTDVGQGEMRVQHQLARMAKPQAPHIFA